MHQHRISGRGPYRDCSAKVQRFIDLANSQLLFFKSGWDIILGPAQDQSMRSVSNLRNWNQF